METLTPDSEFKVHNSIGILLFIIIVYSFIFFSSMGLSDALNGYYYLKLLMFGLVPLLFFGMLLFNRKPVMVVNKTGFYAGGVLVTDWDHFAQAYFYQKDLDAGEFSDQFILIVRYTKDGFEGYFRATIPLTSTQNKSEEAVIAAIDYFSNNHFNKGAALTERQPLKN